MALKATLLLTFLPAFIAATLTCDAPALSYKSKFARYFEAALRSETVALAVHYGELEVDFYSKILENLPANFAKKHLIEEYKNDFKIFFVEIQNLELTTEEIVQKLRDIQQKYVFHNILEILDNTNFDLQHFLMDIGMSEYLEKKKLAGNEFFANMRTKWLELYAKVPAEEISQYVEYIEINELFENEASKLTKMTDALEKAIEFFGLQHWGQLVVRRKGAV